MAERHTPYSLGRLLIWLAMNGYREVPGYTCSNREADGEVYIAMQLAPPRAAIAKAEGRS